SLGCQTKSESTVQAIQSILSEIEKIRRTEVTDEELKLAKESFLNSFVFNFDSAGEIVTRLLTYEYYGYPADFLLQTRDRVETVTKADILRVAKKHLNPTQVRILVVGNPEGFDKPLSTLGDVETLDVTIPSPSLDSGLDDRS
ncbi:MAG TPA: hypothetical protein PLS24_06240, partial [Sedimentisphaerales bacterium]|nr:hypothetical protein [Sedimentisphaerales bacterium]